MTSTNSTSSRTCPDPRSAAAETASWSRCFTSSEVSEVLGSGDGSGNVIVMRVDLLESAEVGPLRVEDKSKEGLASRECFESVDGRPLYADCGPVIERLRCI